VDGLARQSMRWVTSAVAALAGVSQVAPTCHRWTTRTFHSDQGALQIAAGESRLIDWSCNRKPSRMSWPALSPNGRLLPNKFEIPLIAGNGADLSRNST